MCPADDDGPLVVVTSHWRTETSAKFNIALVGVGFTGIIKVVPTKAFLCFGSCRWVYVFVYVEG